MGEDEEQKTKKKCLFSFAKINRYFIIPFLCPVFNMIYSSLLNSVEEDKNNDKKYSFLFSMIDCFSYLPGGLLFFVVFMRTKTEETRNKAIINVEKSVSIEYIYNPIEVEKDERIIIGYLIIISIIDSLYVLSDLLEIWDTGKNQFESIIYYLLLIPLFSKFILKDSIFRHQILSLLLSYIGIIFLCIPILPKIGIDDILVNISNFVVAFLYSLILVLIKKLTDHYFLSPYLCLLCVGIFSSFLT